ncbi:Hypothetical protein NAEGRDRAFT_71103 [Naegleria gruberi]|uniref:F-box domain-containing protein n=1 Tax=Naegleria gruberi TaxID=5762 RepID=D2VPY9_NAEGR|nr:uncharacterized protein NAEGRDRAFT_71103 [Naegleria gruberi]EFC41089.1 Hypothetical protein NAEGRDRAFT_71103 [Naegleria gruberi]|eukprot:XP_002673833.1 Hypothetical protein NAEGRDRAFT_71103 [Naegleria gruberi strain NEG-M]
MNQNAYATVAEAANIYDLYDDLFRIIFKFMKISDFHSFMLVNKFMNRMCIENARTNHRHNRKYNRPFNFLSREEIEQIELLDDYLFMEKNQKLSVNVLFVGNGYVGTTCMILKCLGEGKMEDFVNSRWYRERDFYSLPIIGKEE